MLIGQYQEQDQREKRIQKSQLYKEILDNQVRLNQQLRKGQIDKIRDKNYQTNLQHKYNTVNDNSIIRQIDQKQSRKQNRFLPVIKDSNIFIRGSSRFLKVQQPAKPFYKVGRTYTEQIVEEEDEIDPYESTCERIIKELQNIQSKPVKFRMRRKLYDMTDIHANKRNHFRNYSNQSAKSNQNSHKSNYEESNNEQLNLQNARNKLNSENRYSALVNYQNSQAKMPKIDRQELNQFNNSFISDKNDEKTNEKSKRSPTPALTPPLGSTPVPSQLQKFEHSSSIKQRNAIKIESQQYQSKKSDISRSNKEETPALLKYNKQRLNNSTILDPSSRVRVNSDQSRLVQNNNQNPLLSQHLQRQRETFLQILRKVKNRGESLKLKLAKYPHEKANQEQQ